VTGASTATFSLPATANVGDVVQISGAGAGWIASLPWTARASSQNWYSVASSTDGTKLAAAVNGGQIYTGSSLISGLHGTMATFQYAGNGQWVRMIQAP